MKCFMIARIVKNDSLIGYRLFDKESKKAIEVSKEQLTGILRQSGNAVVNLGIANGLIVGTNGSVDRYTAIDVNTRKMVNDVKSKMVILSSVIVNGNNVGYEVVDCFGNMTAMRKADAVEYCQNYGIANGKVVERDGIPYISAISGNYEEIEVKPMSNEQASSGVIRTTSKGTLAANVKQAADLKISTEDVFQALSENQRISLVQFYMWYTTMVYNSISEGSRFNVPIYKLDRIAELRGLDSWKLAGIIDTSLEKRCGYCEFGHKLRYEYYAIPSDVDINYREARGMKYSEYLKSKGAIVFGETCSADFFEVSREDMKRLVGVRKSMSEELQFIADAAKDGKLEEEKQKVKFMGDLCFQLGKQGGADPTRLIREVFGDEFAMHIINFMGNGLPFTKSMILLMARFLRSNAVFKNRTMETLNMLFPESQWAINKVMKSKLSTDEEVYARRLIDYAFEYSLEGKYQYNPLNEDSKRRDKGKYDKTARLLRRRLDTAIANGSGLGKIIWETEVELEDIRIALDVISNNEIIRKFFDREFDNHNVKDKFGGNKVNPCNFFARLESDEERIVRENNGKTNLSEQIAIAYNAFDKNKDSVLGYNIQDYSMRVRRRTYEYAEDSNGCIGQVVIHAKDLLDMQDKALDCGFSELEEYIFKTDEEEREEKGEGKDTYRVLDGHVIDIEANRQSAIDNLTEALDKSGAFDNGSVSYDKYTKVAAEVEEVNKRDDRLKDSEVEVNKRDEDELDVKLAIKYIEENSSLLDNNTLKKTTDILKVWSSIEKMSYAQVFRVKNTLGLIRATLEKDEPMIKVFKGEKLKDEDKFDIMKRAIARRKEIEAHGPLSSRHAFDAKIMDSITMSGNLIKASDKQMWYVAEMVY